MRTTNSKKKIASLDGIKGLSALGIACVYHLATVPLPYSNGYPLQDIYPIEWMYLHGGYLVEMFLLISGFLTFYLYPDRICSTTGGITLTEYSKKRVIRVFPLMWITLCITVVTTMIYAHSHDGRLFVSSWDASNILALGLNIVGIQFAFSQGQSWNYPAWSLTIFFVCWLFAYIIIRIGKGSRDKICWLCAFMIVAGITLQTSWNPNTFFLNGNVARGYVAFFAGAILYYVQKYVSEHGIGTIVVVDCIIWFLVFGILRYGFGVSMGERSICLSLCVFPQIVLLVLNIPILNRFFSMKLFQFLGAVSFDVYLLNYSIETVLAECNDVFKLGMDFSKPSIFLWYIPLHLLMAAAIHYTVEKRLTERFRTVLF